MSKFRKNLDNDEILSEEQESVERVPPQYEVLYYQICLFEEIRNIPLFNKRK